MLKKLLVPGIVIIAGLMLGIVISPLFSKQNKTNTATIPNNAQSPTNTVTNRTISNFPIQLSIDLDKTSIKTYDKSRDITKDSVDIDKALLTVKYDNTTSNEMKNLKLWLNIPNDGRLDYADSDTVAANKEDIIKTNLRVYDLPDIKPNETVEAQIWIFGKYPGVHTFSGEIKSGPTDVVSNRSNKVTLTLQ
jgi:hypothetical protein